jgi:hypothetical protein
MRVRSPLLGALLVSLVLGGALALPAVASAGAAASGLGGLPGAVTSTSSTATTATATTAPPVIIPSTSSGTSLTTLDFVLIAVAVVILFAGITYWIRRDARFHQPRHATRDINRGRGTVAPQTERRKRARARAKAARRARRRRS